MGQMNEEIEIFRTQVSSRMRMVRKAADFTQDQAAEACDVSPRTYKDYELGRRSMPIEALAKFSKAFHIATDDLLFGQKGASKSTPQEKDLVAEIASGVLTVFGGVEEDDEKDRQIKMVCYAWQGARAKGRDFVDELGEVKSLTL
jgi:transcriptional regulator with XRE-family HTH domain